MMLAPHKLAYGVLTLTMGLLASAQTACSPKLPAPFTLSKETTGIVAPLRPDGSPDYIGALNERCSKGVTSENNGFVLFLQVVGTAIPPDDGDWDTKARDRMLQLCGAKPTPPGAVVWQSYADFLAPNRKGHEEPPGGFDYRQARQELWTPDQRANLAAFLKKQEKLLDTAVEAAARARWWSPLVGTDSCVLGLTGSPFLRGICSVSESLCARATLRARAGDFDGFLRDALAVKQIARHFGRCGTITECVMGLGLDKCANEAIGTVVGSGTLPEAQCAALAKSLAALGPMPSLVESVDGLERFGQLDLLILIAGGGEFASPGISSKHYAAVDRNAVDWDCALKRVNRTYDHVVAALKEPSLAAMRKHMDVAEQKDPRWTAPDLESILDVFKAFKKQKGETREAYSERVATGTLVLHLPSFGHMEEGRRRVVLQDEMLATLVAAARVKAKTGNWPDKLETLVPGTIKDLPTDLYASDEEGPLHYVVTNGRARIYSVAPKGLDRGGAWDNINVGDRPPQPAPPTQPALTPTRERGRERGTGCFFIDAGGA